MSFLGNLKDNAGHDGRDREADSDKIARAVDGTQPKAACEEDEDMDDDVAMTFPQRVSLQK